MLLTSCDVGAGGAAMRDSAYRDPEARSMVNAEFIPIRVDTDHRPDINARYNLGGWRHGGADADVRRSLVGLRSARRNAQILAAGQRNSTSETESLASRLNKRSRTARPELQGTGAGPVHLQIVDDFGEHSSKASIASTGFRRVAEMPNLMCSSSFWRSITGRVITSYAVWWNDSDQHGDWRNVRQGKWRVFPLCDDEGWTITQYEKLLKDNAKLLPSTCRLSGHFAALSTSRRHV